MTLKAKILEDMKEAVKNGDRMRRTVTRMLLSELNYAESSLPAHAEIDDVSSAQVINNYYKKLLKTVARYPNAKERHMLHAEIAIVEQYLPATKRMPTLVNPSVDARTLLKA